MTTHPIAAALNDDAPPTHEAKAGQSGAQSGVASSDARKATTPERYTASVFVVQPSLLSDVIGADGIRLAEAYVNAFADQQYPNLQASDTMAASRLRLAERRFAQWAVRFLLGVDAQRFFDERDAATRRQFTAHSEAMQAADRAFREEQVARRRGGC